MPNKGKVYIMGVGPGDYKLLTLKAVESIKKADVIVYDRLVNTKILSFAKKDAELVYVGKMPDYHIVPQDAINKILLEKASEGKTVARVKGGDPFVFGRGGEEAEYLYEHGIEFEIIPGISSAIAVPAYAGIPVTHRDYCSSLHIITGHERPDKEESSLDFAALAKLDGTLIFLMGIKNLSNIAEGLIKHGKSGATPAAVIERGTTHNQRSVVGTLADIAAVASAAGISSPAVTVIGEVVHLKSKLEWVKPGKLAGKSVIITRAREQASKLVERIEELSGEAIEFPVIKIAEPEDYSLFDHALEQVEHYQWLVFTSVNGVESFFKRMRLKKTDIRRLAGIKLCAVGEATAEKLYDMGFNVDFVPESFTTENLLKGLLERVSPKEKVLLARADIANPILSKGLSSNQIEFDEITVYRTLIESTDRNGIINRFIVGSIDFITFTSSSTVSNFVTILGKENLNEIEKAKVVCIGPVTAKTAEELGVKVDAIADAYTIEGLVDKLVELAEESPWN
ncbi:MAG: uroporphyrinogen-III C-methyltransferase [Clostridia bacterium]|nr:uroporphyrinogen-III C-methyltransferase [Clostridia bacterium]